MAASRIASRVVSNSEVEAKVFAKLAQLQLPRDGVATVAFSGGGDSTALLAILLKWYEQGTVIAFIVDHGLRNGSDHEAKLAQRRAQTMGAEAKILTCKWSNNIPTTGIQEKARNARYKLLAQACDDLAVEGLPLFIGHNQDDQAETVLMREQAGSGWRGLAGISDKTVMPIYPTISKVKVYRPLLSSTRDELRVYNIANGHNWIEDPSNENRSFARIRTRDYLALHPQEKKRLLLKAEAARETLKHERAELSDFIKENTVQFSWGAIALKPSFQNEKLGKTAEALKYILQAIAGQGTAPNVEKCMRLARQLRKENFKSATLGGVRFFLANEYIYCVRDLGALTGRHQISPLPPLTLFGAFSKHKKQVWDGRYGVELADGLTVEALANWSDKLGKRYRQALQLIPEPARGGLPVFIRNEQVVFVPFLDGFESGVRKTPDYWVKSLVPGRLYALLSE